MANVRLKDLTFPGLDNTYKLPVEASDFSTSSTYAVGDYCIHDGVLCRCTTAITTAGVWDSTKWSTDVKLAEDVSSQSAKIDDLKSAFLNDLSQNTDYVFGGVFTVPQSYLEQGAIGSDGKPINNPVSQTRIRTKYKVYVKTGYSFGFQAGSKCQLLYWFFFKDSGTLETSGEWVSSATKTFAEDGYLLLCFRKNNQGNIAPSDYDATVTFKTNTSNITENSSEINNAFDTINGLHNLINYGYDKSYDIAPSSTSHKAQSVGFKREKGVLTLNTILEPDVYVRIKLNGDMMRSYDTEVIATWTGVTLTSGHKYILKAIPISGTATTSANGIPNLVGAFEEGSTASIGTSWLEGKTYCREFIYGNTPVSIVFGVQKETSYTNYKCLITLEDITEQGESGNTRVDEYDNAIETSSQGANDGVKLKVVSYNVAGYNNDTATYLTTDKEINFKKMLCEIEPDILAIQEDSNYIDSGETRQALKALYNPIFPYQYLETSGVQCTIRSKTAAVTHDILKYSNGRWIEFATFEINGHTLLFGSTHTVADYQSTGIDSAESIAARLVQYEELVDWLNGTITLKSRKDNSDVTCPSYDWCIMCGDYNTITDDDKTNLITTATDGNFKLANGDWLGWIETNYKFAEPLCLDNVMVSENVIFNSIISHSSMLSSLYSDHVPFEVTVTLQNIT